MTTEILNEDERADRFDAHWDQRLDDLVAGACGEEEFIAEVEALHTDAIESPWSVLALMDQRFRRGQLPGETFRAIEARIARSELNIPNSDATVDLDPAEPPAISHRIREYSREESDAERDPARLPDISQQMREYSREESDVGLDPAELPVISQQMREFSAEESDAGFDPAELPVISQQIREYDLEDSQGAPQLDDVVVVESVSHLDEEPAAGPMLRDRYEIKGAVGVGGMGTVYQAIDHFRRDRGHAQSYVALKALQEGTAGHPQALARLRRAFYSAQSLAHRNIVKVFDIDRDGAVDFFTMEYLDGEPLSRVLELFNRQPLPREAAWSIVRQLAEALAHAHDRRVVHGALNPHNVMILHSGDVRILNFGASLAGHLDESASAYASGDLIAGQTPDARDDLFSLACLACQMLAGVHPYEGRQASEARALGLKPVRPPGLTSRQWRVLEQGLAFDRKERTVTVRDWFKALGAETTTWEGIPRPPEATAAPLQTGAVSRRRSSRPVRFIATLGSIALIGLLAVLYFREAPVRQANVVPAVAPPAMPRPPIEERAEVAPAAVTATQSAPAVPQGSAAAPPSSPKSVSPRSQPIVAAPATAARSAPAVPRNISTPQATVKNVPKSGPVAPRVAAATPAVAPPNSAGAARAPRRAAKAAGGTYSLSSRGYQVRAAARFVEVKVVRSDPSAPASFNWWTEDGSALAGIDFIAQPRTTAFFAAGSRVMTLFVKTAGNEPRRDPVNFTVQIASPSSGAVETARTRVTLLPSNR